MKRKLILVVVVGLLTPGIDSGVASGQGIAVSGKVSTLGIGADVSLGVTRMIGIRGGVNFQPYEPSREFDELDYTLDLASPSWMALVDFSPAGSFRLTGGMVYFGSTHEVRAELTGPVEIGNQTYTSQEVGTLSGLFETKEVAPYAGIGFGRLGGRRGIGFAVDLGVAFQGEPDVQLSASGPIASQPAFQANLAQEELNIEEDAKPFRFYPVLSLALVFGF